MNVTLREFLCF